MAGSRENALTVDASSALGGLWLVEVRAKSALAQDAAETSSPAVLSYNSMLPVIDNMHGYSAILLLQGEANTVCAF